MRTFWAILALTFVCVMINFPEKITVFNKTFYRPNFSFNLGSFQFKKDFDLKYGLDLAGGASLTYKIDTSSVSKDDLEDALIALKSNIEKRINLFGTKETNVQIIRQDDEHRLKVELPGVSDISDAINTLGRTAQLSFYGVVDENLFYEATNSAEFYQSIEDTGLNGSHLIKATTQLNANNSEPEVSLEFNEEGKELFKEATTKFLNKPIIIMLDDEVLTAPTVNTVISDGKAVISGSFDSQSAKTLSIQLTAGSLSLPIELIQQSQVGATLGQDSINKGIFAGIVGLILVAIFMIGNYGKLGLIADVSLIIYSLITLTLYRLIPVTLTFPGIVGFILSIGMAVDSNILVFERMKEELRDGKEWNNAIELSFGRAWKSIKDANTCTLIIGFILFNPLNWSFLNTSGMVRGFAVTLILGIIVGVFTSVFITRNLLRVLAKKNKI